MVLKKSKMLPLGTAAPSFALPEPLTSNTVTLQEVKGEMGTFIIFMCNHCPFVKHIAEQLQILGKDLAEMGIGMVDINSNDVVAYREDSPQAMAELARDQFSTFKYLFDESQEIAKAYKAMCTPDLYLFNKDLELVYRGQLDSSRPGSNVPVTGESLRSAAKLLTEGKNIPEESMLPSIGCNIKWKEGNEPEYY